MAIGVRALRYARLTVCLVIIGIPQVGNHVQSVPSISKTTPFSAGASSVPHWPRGAKRRLPFCVDAILMAVDVKQIGIVCGLERVERKLLETLEGSVRIYIRVRHVRDRCCVKFTRMLSMTLSGIHFSGRLQGAQVCVYCAVRKTQQSSSCHENIYSTESTSVMGKSSNQNYGHSKNLSVRFRLSG